VIAKIGIGIIKGFHQSGDGPGIPFVSQHLSDIEAKVSIAFSEEFEEGRDDIHTAEGEHFEGAVEGS